MGLSEVGTALRARVPELGERMAERIRDEVESYADESLIPFASLRHSCRGNADLILRHIATGPDSATDVRPARDTGRLRAEQGVPLADTLHAYRVGSEFLWAQVVAEAPRHPQVTDAHLVAGSSEIWALSGRYAEAVAAAYRETSAELVLQREARRSALVEALLSGALAGSATPWEVARQLGLPERGPYAVVAASVPDPGQEPLPGIEAALRQAHLASAWRLLPDEQIGLVALARQDAEAVVLRELRRCRARVGVSPRFDALRDTPQALRFARLALSGLTGDEAGVARFDDSPLTMVVAAAPAEATRLVQVAMGPLLDLPEAERARLLGTLGHWFSAGGVAAEAADRLYVHPNTVRYRLRRIEKLTRRSLSDPAAVADLGAALHALRLVPR
ncbi:MULTISPECIES: CdaR family transcriptional regulator [unclassified Streptomyces]|uniref:PucR family transcriptional regulator n=1 Tax=unclassified Streptomyces TaxID=2593676 RepID=UPI001F03842D|nr:MULTISPECIES: helix-turn-helix domain-containing protein [unclassified Streptomyces]MCH0564208.1 helix-turn-helix domain-containing protein [Streptomyces sp. MUM 2J]MCH0568510.1 helix-turn-helix domain-containing protein [Streptomyces sp. MUM 136J]